MTRVGENVTWTLDGEDEIAEVGSFRLRLRWEDGGVRTLFGLRGGQGEIALYWGRARPGATLSDSREGALVELRGRVLAALMGFEALEALPPGMVRRRPSLGIPDGAAIGVCTTPLGSAVTYTCFNGVETGDIGRANTLHISDAEWHRRRTEKPDA